EYPVLSRLPGALHRRRSLRGGPDRRGRGARDYPRGADAGRREPRRGKLAMSNTAIGLLGLGALFALFILRMPVGLSMLTTGLLGTVAIRGWSHALPSLSSETFAIASFYQLSIIPMFVLMGNVAGASGMGRDLYDAAYAWVGHIRGGLASATVIACACFA